MIPEPQRTYLLELLQALGPSAENFVVAGAQALKFILERARGTKDIDFVLDVVKLRSSGAGIGATLRGLDYVVVDGSRNFQFEKRIPNGAEVMRIELMAPEEFKREKDFRVDVDKDVHARACTGGSIALAESTVHEIRGKLPDGSTFACPIRVTKAHALVMLKLLALDDRYRNIRGLAASKHDREEARVHAADILAIVSAQTDMRIFKADFERQFSSDPTLGSRVETILETYFRDNTSPGLLVYEEFLVAGQPIDAGTRREAGQEIERAHQLMLGLLDKPAED